MGKIEFLTKDLMPVAEANGFAVGYCNLWQEDQEPLIAIAGAIRAMAAPKRMRDKLQTALRSPITKLKVSGAAGGMAEGSAELEFKSMRGGARNQIAELFADFVKGRRRGVLLIDEAQVLADKQHSALERALRAALDTRKDRIKVLFTGSSEDRLRTMFGSERKPFYNWARVEPLPLLGDAFVRDLTTRANTLTTAKLKVKDSLRAFDALHRVPELFRRFLSQYLSNPFDGVDLAIEICEQSVYVEEGFQLRWQIMLPADRAILRLIADGNRTLHGADTLQRLGEVLGLPGSANRNVPQNSLRRLRSRQMIIQVEPGVYRFEDDAFRAWVLNEAAE